LLADHFLHKHALDLGRPTPKLGAHVLERLESYDWPGNVRELENLMERATVLCRGNEITSAYLPVELEHQRITESLSPGPIPEGASLGLKERVEALERELIAAALARCDNSKAGAARLLGVSERTLWYKLKAYQL
jgi:two-component system response regulator AtoC